METSFHILVVDPSSETRSRLYAQLQERGYRVSVVKDSRAMWHSLVIDSPDLVVLDAMVRGENGEALLPLLIAKTRIPVIMLSAPGDEAARIAFLEAGAADCLSKPISPGEVVARTATVLRRTHTCRETTA